MNDQIKICIDREVYEGLQRLMSPPVNDANGVIKSLLHYDGHGSRAALAMRADQQHFSYKQELERASQGVYDCGGCT